MGSGRPGKARHRRRGPATLGATALATLVAVAVAGLPAGRPPTAGAAVVVASHRAVRVDAAGSATLIAGTTTTAVDTFLRPDTTSSWGTTTNSFGLANYTWRTGLGTSSPYGRISKDQGVITYTGTDGHKLAWYVDTPPVLGGNTVARFSFSATNAPLAGVIVQHSNSSNWYQADIATVTGFGFTKNTLELTIRRAGVMIHAADVPFAVVANKEYWIREVVQVSGGVAHIEARAWADGTPEPATWSVVSNDPTPLPAGNGGAMGDWLAHPAAGEQVRFSVWAYSAG